MRRAMVVTVTLVTLIGCGGGHSSVEPTDKDVIVPLEVGNQWVYRATPFPGAAARPGDTITVIGEDSIGGTSWHAVRLSDVSSFTGVPTIIHWSNRADGLWARVESEPGRLLYESLFAKFPAKVGDRYEIPWIGVGITVVVTVESVGDTICVPAGTFEVNAYSFSVNPDRYGGERDYFSPGIGLVKKVGITSDPDLGAYEYSSSELCSMVLGRKQLAVCNGSECESVDRSAARAFADLHWDSVKYVDGLYQTFYRFDKPPSIKDAWLDTTTFIVIDSQNNINPRQLSHHAWYKNGGTKVERAELYFNIAAFDQFNFGWDDYPAIGDTAFPQNPDDPRLHHLSPNRRQYFQLSKF